MNVNMNQQMNTSNFSSSFTEPGPAAGSPSLQNYVPPSFGGGQGQFHNPQNSYQFDQMLLQNPNLTPEQRDRINEINILKRSGFFGDISYQNNESSANLMLDNSQQTMFQINPNDLATPLESEVPNAQKLLETISFRRQNVQNEMTFYAQSIAEQNVQINSMISAAHTALANLKQAQAVVQQLSPQISSTRNPGQLTQLQQQFNAAYKNAEQQMAFLQSTMSRAIEIRKLVTQHYDIVKRIAGANTFGNVDFENATKAAYDVVLAEESIRQIKEQADSTNRTVQQNNRSFVSGTNSLCFVKTGQQFWKNSPNEIIPQMVNISTSRGSITRLL